jgi:small-conductance mechanosensitive channel
MALSEVLAVGKQFLSVSASALIILLIGFIAGKILGKLAQRGLHVLELNPVLKRAGVDFGLEEFLGHIVKYFVYFVAIILALGQLGVAVFVLYIVIGIVVVVLGIALLLSIKDFLPNFIAGASLIQKKLFRPGDVVFVGSVQGKVKEVGLLATTLEHKGDLIHVPNSMIIRQKIRVRKK